MSEAEGMENQGEGQTSSEKTSEIKIDVEAIKAAAVEAAKAAIAEQTKEAATVSKKDLDTAIANYKKELARSITGEKDEEEIDPVLKYLVNSPKETLLTVKEQAKAEALAEIRGQIAQEKQDIAAYNSVFGERPDIDLKGPEMKVIGALIKDTDEGLSTEERAKEALKQYDLMMEARGLGDAKKRIAEASSSVRASASKDAGNVPVSEEEVYRSEIEEIRQKERAMRSWN